MAWCQTAPSHYLNQCRLLISEVLSHPSEQISQQVSKLVWKSYLLNYCHISHGPVKKIILVKLLPHLPQDSESRESTKTLVPVIATRVTTDMPYCCTTSMTSFHEWLEPTHNRRLFHWTCNSLFGLFQPTRKEVFHFTATSWIPIVDRWQDFLGSRELDEALEFCETAVFTVWDTCVRNKAWLDC